MYLYFSIFFAVLGMWQFGYQSTVLNLPQTDIENFFKDTFQKRNIGTLPMPDDTASTLYSVATSLLLVGGIVGSLATGWVGNTFGRKKGIVYVQLISLSSSAFGGICQVSNSFEILFLSRFLAGLSCGLFTGLVPLYVTEIAPLHLRGAAGTTCNLATTFGLVVGMVLGLDEILGGPDSWPYLFFVPAGAAIIQLIALPFMPEAPDYLILNQRDLEEGRKALIKLRGTSDVDEEIQEIIQESEKNGSPINEDHGSNENLVDDKLSILQILGSSKYWLPLFLCLCIQLSQQATGMIALIFYSTNFFLDAGLSSNVSNYASISIAGILFTMTGVSVFLMEKLGRRTLHVYIGMTGMLVCSVVLNFSLIMEGLNQDNNNNTTNATGTDLISNYSSDQETSVWGIIVIISTLSYVVVFGLGPASIPWLITPELFEPGPRGAATSLSIFANWTTQLVIALTFPQIIAAIGSYHSFLPFLGLLIILYILLFIYFPETKNQSSSDTARLFELPRPWLKPIGYKSKQLLEGIRN